MTISSDTGAGGIGAGGGGGGDDRPPNEQGQMVDFQGARLDLNSIATTERIASVVTQYQTPLTMLYLHQFDVPTQVGPHYMTFGVLLLDDPTGMTVTNIHAQAHCITRTVQKILTIWLSTGTRTWEQLIETLRNARLYALASDIKGKLRRKPFSTRTGWASPHTGPELHCSSEILPCEGSVSSSTGSHSLAPFLNSALHSHQPPLQLPQPSHQSYPEPPPSYQQALQFLQYHPEPTPSYQQATSQDGTGMTEANTTLDMLRLHKSPCIPFMKICYKELFALLGLSQDQISEIVRDNPGILWNRVHDGFLLLWKLGYRFTWRSIWELLANNQTPDIIQLRREIERHHLSE